MNSWISSLMGTNWREWTASNIIGSYVTKGSKVDEEITVRIQAASRAMGSLTDTEVFLL